MSFVDVILNGISSLLKTILLTLIAILSCIRIRQLVMLIKDSKGKNEYIEDLKFGVLSKKDLLNYTPLEFEHWCAEFLVKKGFTNLQVTANGQDGGKDIICKKGHETYYVECKRYSYSNSSEFTVDLSAARKLVGAMEGDGIRKGIIITTGHATERALEYIKTLPKEYELSIIDGDELIQQYTAIKHFVYMPEKS
jgi:HJR/Mrr/RecB family endonuclease